MNHCTPYSLPTACIHYAVENQVQNTPRQIAVRSQTGQLTYQELNHKANQLAHYLQKRQITLESPVGICLERGLDLLVGILGILKAGGAYLPLDPNYPLERLHFMQNDAGVQLILSNQTCRKKISGSRRSVVLLDEEQSAIQQESGENPPQVAGPDHLAYIIYTSGSTGKPKGVMIPHRGVVNHCTAMAREFVLQPQDRVLQFSTINFDLAVEEIFPTWISGSTLVLRSESVIFSIPDVMQMLEQEQITVLDLPTAFWHEWMRSLTRNRIPMPSSLRLVVVGGECALLEIYQIWQELTQGKIRWINTYGPTETTVTATLYDPNRDAPPPHSYISLGRPIANTQIHVLDSDLHPVPRGTPGELYIGGAGVARGYLNRPELTREKFIPDSFSEVPNARLYRTGDRVVYQPDGGLQFLGRMDHQVKIRGFRVELGEIVAAIKQHPSISQAAVVSQEEGGEVKKLIAFLILREGKTVERNQIRSFLKTLLPDYMVPAEYVFCCEFPVTPGGKIDYEALKVLRK